MSKINWPWGRNTRSARTNERRSARYLSGIAAEFGWWHEGAFHSSPVVIIDVSQGGAAVLIDEPPPEGGAAHLRTVGEAATDWVEVEILSVRASKGNRSAAHLKFINGPSYTLFRSAIPDTSLDQVWPEDDPEIYDPRSWR